MSTTDRGPCNTGDPAAPAPNTEGWPVRPGNGLEAVEMLMTAYMSAEQGRTLDWKPAGLETFVPGVAKGTWRPGR